MDNSTQPTPENNQSDAPVIPVIPLAPMDTEKNIRNGWLLFTSSVAIFIIGIWLGVALAASALVAALAGRIGLQNKSKPLAIVSITFSLLMLALFGLSAFLSP